MLCLRPLGAKSTSLGFLLAFVGGIPKARSRPSWGHRQCIKLEVETLHQTTLFAIYCRAFNSLLFFPTFLAKPIDSLSDLTWRRLSHSKRDGIYLDLEGSVELRDWNALALWDKMQRVDNYMSRLEFNHSLCIYATGSIIINPFNRTSNSTYLLDTV